MPHGRAAVKRAHQSRKFSTGYLRRSFRDRATEILFDSFHCRKLFVSTAESALQTIDKN
jgi:hypothetical protein